MFYNLKPKPETEPKYALDGRVMFKGEVCAQIALDLDESDADHGWAYQVVFIRADGKLDWGRGIHIVYEKNLDPVNKD